MRALIEADGSCRYDLVIFDLDLTIFDFEASERLAYAHTLATVGEGVHAPPSFDRYRAINAPLWKAVERGELTPAQAGRRRFELLCDELAIDGADPAAMDSAFQYGLGAFGDLYPDAERVLDVLASAVPLALVTNGISAVQRAKIDRLGLVRWFSPIVISDDVGIAKPDPAIFDLACTPHRTGGTATAMIGDSLTSDMAGAAAAGIDGYWFNPHRTPRPDEPPVLAEFNRLTDLVRP